MSIQQQVGGAAVGIIRETDATGVGDKSFPNL
jgi:hypothetical protein